MAVIQFQLACIAVMLAILLVRVWSLPRRGEAERDLHDPREDTAGEQRTGGEHA